MKIKRLLSRKNPFPIPENCPFSRKIYLPCNWISYPGINKEKPCVMLFQLTFEAKKNFKSIIHVSADQQYQLFGDNNFGARGCEMKSPERWYYESYEISVPKGRHTLSAIVWNYGNLSPMNRMSIRPGFFLLPETPYISELGTGIADWKVKKLTSFDFEKLIVKPGAYISVAPHEIQDIRKKKDDVKAQCSKAITTAKGINGFLATRSDAHCLLPYPLRKGNFKEFFPGKAVHIFSSYDKKGRIPQKTPATGKLNSFNSMLNNEKIFFTPYSEKKIILRLDNYYCAFTKLKFSGGKDSKIKLTWAEATFTHPEKPMKSKRDKIRGNYFRGVWDEIITDGNPHTWSPLSWRSGCYIELHVKTAGEPLALEGLLLEETRFPLEMDAGFSCDDDKINALIPFCFRTLMMSAHENFVDCPFYEQLFYGGDGRLEAQTALVLSEDDSLVIKGISTLASSRDINGTLMARWPSIERQYIPSFSMWWVGMLYDYALWRNNKNFIQRYMPCMRNLLDNFMLKTDDEGFLRGVPWEWNFIDWVDEWFDSVKGGGTPPGINHSANASYNWLFIYILGLAEKLELYAGSRDMAARWEKTADILTEKNTKRFWDDSEGLFKENDEDEHFSEHAQILAILSGKLKPEYKEKIKKAMASGRKLAPSSIFYKYYLFEAMAQLEMPEKILSGFGLWHKFIGNGFKTSPETPVNKTFNQRSDCHGWGAHPLYHLTANIAGIKPAEMGFKKVRITPRPGHLKKINAECVHPDGIISMRLFRNKSGTRVETILPDRLKGEFIFAGNTVPLKSGKQEFTIPDMS